MKGFGIYVFLVAAVILWAVPADATLIDNGGGFIYDTDLNITWYDAPSVSRPWNLTVAWVATLTIGGTKAGTWRLPNAFPVNGTNYNYSFSFDGSTDYAYNIISTNSELSHLFYIGLGNKGYFDKDGNIQAGYGLLNKGPFVNLKALANYCSGMTYSLDPDQAWNFDFNYGYQYWAGSEFYALPVHAGNIGAPVPVPSTILLLIPGLGGIIVFGRKLKLRKA
jgi:hypothetical protein